MSSKSIQIIIMNIINSLKTRKLKIFVFKYYSQYSNTYCNLEVVFFATILRRFCDGQAKKWPNLT